jgi:hypothetical protein
MKIAPKILFKGFYTQSGAPALEFVRGPESPLSAFFGFLCYRIHMI